MDSKLVTAEQHEIESLARKPGTSVERVNGIIQHTGSRSREQIEAALDRQFQRWWEPPVKRVLKHSSE